MFFLREYGFDGPFSSSEAFLQNVWSEYKETCSFQFVRVYASDITWIFDYSEDTFLSELTYTANDIKGLQLFFGRSLWVQQQLQRTLDSRALPSDTLFSFPKDLAPSSFRIPKASAAVYAQLGSYSRDRAGI